MPITSRYIVDSRRTVWGSTSWQVIDGQTLDLVQDLLTADEARRYANALNQAYACFREATHAWHRQPAA